MDFDLLGLDKKDKKEVTTTSACCDSRVTTSAEAENWDVNSIGVFGKTNYYICLACNKSCEVKL